MICPDCFAEYIDNIENCGDCNVPLINASNIDLPIPNLDWISLQPFEGKIYADMVGELLDQNSIPYYLKMDWTSSAFGIEAASLNNQIIRIFVPDQYYKKAAELTLTIIGNKK
tara:strand:- start:1327 stop:1665 length:339 start_codon:yes stop_codon:yes gene_type:complete